MAYRNVIKCSVQSASPNFLRLLMDLLPQ